MKQKKKKINPHKLPEKSTTSFGSIEVDTYVGSVTPEYVLMEDVCDLVSTLGGRIERLLDLLEECDPFIEDRILKKKVDRELQEGTPF